MLEDNLLVPGNPPRFRNIRYERESESLYPRLVMAQVNLFDALRPASDSEIAVNLELLRARYPAFSEDESDKVADQLEDEWLDDLSGYPTWAIVRARALWRQKDTAFSPRSAGQLMAPVRPDVNRIRTLLRRANDAIKACDALVVT